MNKATEPKKVLFFCKHLKQGGAEKVCIDLINGFLKFGYYVDVVTLSDDSVQFGSSMVRRLSLGIGRDENDLIRFIKLVKSLKIVNQFIGGKNGVKRYDLITSHLPMSYVLTMLSYARQDAIYVIHSDLDYLNKYGISKYIYKWFIRMFFGNKKIVTVSRRLKEELVEDYDISPKNVRSIYNPIDVKKIQKLSKEEIEEDFGKYILNVGRLTPQKNQSKLLEVYKKAFSSDYNLVICGEGELESELKNKADVLGIGTKVFFIGWKSNPYKYMRNAEIVLSTSIYEGFPIALLEAFACNAKVVASNCNFGPDEILIDEFADYLVNSQEDDEYIKIIKKALDSYPIGNNKILRLCDIEYVVNEYLTFGRCSRG